MKFSIFQNYTRLISHALTRFRRVLGGVTSYRVSDHKMINKDFFGHLDVVTVQDIQDIGTHIDHAIAALQMVWQIITLDRNLNNIQQQYIHKIIKGYLQKLQMLHHALILEANKAWLSMDQQTLIDHEQQLCDIETEVYGPQVCDVYHEVHSILGHLSMLIDQYQKSQTKHPLPPALESDYQWFVWQTMQRISSYQHHDTHQDCQVDVPVLSYTVDMFQFVSILSQVFEMIGKQTILICYQETAEPYYDGVHNILHLPLHYSRNQLLSYLKTHQKHKLYRIILDPHKTSISTSLHAIKIPSRYDSLTVKRVCELINHEVMTHFVRSYNNTHTLVIKSPDIAQDEEWLAIMNEKLVTHNIDQLPSCLVDIHMISTYIGEQFNAHDATRYLKIYYILQWENPKKAQSLAHHTTVRIKRFHSLTHTYSNRKDVWYTRWYQKTLQYFKSSRTDMTRIVSDLYDGKISVDDLVLGSELFESCDREGSYLIHPLPIGTILYQCVCDQTPDLHTIQNDPRYTVLWGAYMTDHILQQVIAIANQITPQHQKN